MPEKDDAAVVDNLVCKCGTILGVRHDLLLFFGQPHKPNDEHKVRCGNPKCGAIMTWRAEKLYYYNRHERRQFSAQGLVWRGLQ